MTKNLKARAQKISTLRKALAECLVRLANLPGKRIATIQILGNLLELENSLRMSQNEIIEYQNRKLVNLINHAYHTVPLYRRLFKKHKIDPNDIQTVKDLNRLPVIDKKALRSFPLKDRISTAVSKQPLKKLFTGGSTGQPFEIYLTRQELNIRAAHRWRIYFHHGYNLLDKEAAVEGLYGTVEKGLLNRFGLFTRVEVPFDISIPDQLEIVLKEKSEIYEGYPSRLHAIARHIEKAHLKIKRPKVIFVDSETLLPHVRNTIEKVFGIKVTNVYDSFEFGYTAWECREHNGFHINSESQIIQIMKDNIEVDDGIRGEIVITNLDSYAMPLIRYNTLDIGAKSEKECICGINLPLLLSLDGRKWDFLISPSEEEIPPILVEQFIRVHEGIFEYRITQNKKEELDIDIVALENYDSQTDSLIKKQLKDLYHFKQINIRHPQSLERTHSGKLRCVVRNC